MGCIPGVKGSLEVSEDGGVTWYRVEMGVTFTLEVNADQNECTSKDNAATGGYKSYEYGFKDATITGNCRADDLVPGQTIVMNAILFSRKIWARFKLHAASGGRLWTSSDVMVTRWSPSSPEDISALDFTMALGNLDPVVQL